MDTDRCPGRTQPLGTGRDACLSPEPRPSPQDTHPCLRPGGEVTLASRQLGEDAREAAARPGAGHEVPSAGCCAERESDKALARMRMSGGCASVVAWPACDFH